MLAFKHIKLAIEAKPYQLGRFLVVGGLSTIVNYSSFYFLLSQMSWGYIHSASSGFLLGVLVGYYLNKAWTFGVEEANAFVFLKYLSVYIASLLSGMTFLYFQVETLDFNVYHANGTTIAFTTITNYVGVKFWAFR